MHLPNSRRLRASKPILPHVRHPVKLLFLDNVVYYTLSLNNMYDMPANVPCFDDVDFEVATQLEAPALLDPDDPHQWRAEAICKTIYGESSHKWCGDRAAPRTVEKRICWEECPVRRECLTWAINEMEKHCIYGGYNYGERRQIWREWTRNLDYASGQRTHVDQDSVYQLITEASIAQIGSLPIWGNPSHPAFDDLESPSDDDLKAIEAEELVSS